MARKLTGKGLLAFLLCHFIPRPRPSWQRCFAEHGRPRDGGGLFSLASRSATRDRRVETVFRVGRAYPGTSRQIQEMPHSPTVTKYICCKSLSCTSQIVWMLSVIGSRRRRAREPFWGTGTFNVGLFSENLAPMLSFARRASPQGCLSAGLLRGRVGCCAPLLPLLVSCRSYNKLVFRRHQGNTSGSWATAALCLLGTPENLPGGTEPNFGNCCSYWPPSRGRLAKAPPSSLPR